MLVLDHFLDRFSIAVMTSSYKLPFNFDPERLQRDVNQLLPDDWVSHFNHDYYEGQWIGVALRSVDGVARRLYPDPRARSPYADTPLLDRCEGVREVLARFRCPLRSVRFLKLTSGSRIREHRDDDLGIATGLVRFHLVVTTNPQVEFFLDAHPVQMNAGECWYLDLSLPHWVANLGPTDRVHLVIDCEPNEWLRSILPVEDAASTIGPAAKEEQPQPGEFERFRNAVLNDTNLQRRLRDTADRASFLRLVASLGREGGYRFAIEEVESALIEARQAWFAG